MLYLTKPIGVGILTTAEKQGIVSPEDLARAVDSMQALNRIGEQLGGLEGVHAMTDVTGFGLLGHLLELAEGSGVHAVLRTGQVPLLNADRLRHYVESGAVPGGAKRNFSSYGHRVDPTEGFARAVLCDPQTSGGLLVAVHPARCKEVERALVAAGCPSIPIGSLVVPVPGAPVIRLLP